MGTELPVPADQVAGLTPEPLCASHYYGHTYKCTIVSVDRHDFNVLGNSFGIINVDLDATGRQMFTYSAFVK
jgi:hypothetical protein